MPNVLSKIETFGTVGAEDDTAILQYFLSTSTVDLIGSGKKMLILGRKGSGKTALVRYFENRRDSQALHVALRLRDYPWNVHAQRKTTGSADIEVYVASWRYLIAVQVLAALVRYNRNLLLSPAAAIATEFIRNNYNRDDVDLRKTLTPNRIVVKSGVVKGSLFGLIDKEISWDRPTNEIGHNLEEITDALMRLCAQLAGEQSLKSVFLHFDELDQGLHTLKDDRRLLLTGLVLSSRSLRNQTKSLFSVKPIIYLRTDIWDQLVFSDKNKIAEDLSQSLQWSAETLLQMINLRIKAKTENTQDWDTIHDHKLMRGSQEKWKYIMARTFLRPRDVIAFLNKTLEAALIRNVEADQFVSEDIFSARQGYSSYLKSELDEEILPHWPQWEEALRACSAIATLSLTRKSFDEEYSARKTKKNQLDADEALETLFGYSVVGYRRGKGSGGTEWIYQYSNPNSKWDTLASLIKVHVGLKEYFGLAESSVD